MKRFLVYPLSLLILSGLSATDALAQKKTLTIQEAITGYHLYPKRMNQLKWVDATHFSYTSDNRKTLVVVEIEDKYLS